MLQSKYASALIYTKLYSASHATDIVRQKSAIFVVIHAPPNPARSHLMNLFKRFFPKQSKKGIGPDAKEILARILENELATMEMQSTARTDAGPYAILTPAVPLPAKDAVGWFGGTARLPKELAWPEIEGTPLCFVAQIDLAQVPQNIWSGAGPRHGQLAFFIHPTATKAKVLHVDGALQKRSGPSPVSSHWFRKHYDKRPPVSAYFPEWPVRLTGNVGELPEPAGWRKGCAPSFPDPFEKETLNLADRAHHPFDEATLEALLKQCDGALNSRLGAIEKLLETKKLKEDVGTALRTLHAEVVSSYKRFSEIKRSLGPCCKAFDKERIVPYMNALGDLPLGHTTYRRDDEEGYAEIEVSWGKLSSYAAGYLRILERHAKYTYLEAQKKLTAEARARFETIWAFDAVHERGGMSHPPKGFVYTPPGPLSPNEVLLELPTSDLIGWIWGDMYSVVLTVARDDLANGKLDNILVDITN